MLSEADKDVQFKTRLGDDIDLLILFAGLADVLHVVRSDLRLFRLDFLRRV